MLYQDWKEIGFTFKNVSLNIESSEENQSISLDVKSLVDITLRDIPKDDDNDDKSNYLSIENMNKLYNKFIKDGLYNSNLKKNES